MLNDRRSGNKYLEILLPVLLSAFFSSVSIMITLKVAVAELKTEMKTRVLYIERDISDYKGVAEKLNTHSAKLEVREAWMSHINKFTETMLKRLDFIEDDIKEKTFKLQQMNKEIEILHEKHEALKIKVNKRRDNGD